MTVVLLLAFFGAKAFGCSLEDALKFEKSWSEAELYKAFSLLKDKTCLDRANFHGQMRWACSGSRTSRTRVQRNQVACEVSKKQTSFTFFLEEDMATYTLREDGNLVITWRGMNPRRGRARLCVGADLCEAWANEVQRQIEENGITQYDALDKHPKRVLDQVRRYRLRYPEFIEASGGYANDLIQKKLRTCARFYPHEAFRKIYSKGSILSAFCPGSKSHPVSTQALPE